MQQIRIQKPKKPPTNPVLDLRTPSGRVLPY
jgi:hypothetical protein